MLRSPGQIKILSDDSLTIIDSTNVDGAQFIVMKVVTTQGHGQVNEVSVVGGLYINDENFGTDKAIIVGTYR